MIINNVDVSLAVRWTSFLFMYDWYKTELIVIDSFADYEDDKWIIVTDNETYEQFIVRAEEKIIKEKNNQIQKLDLKLEDAIVYKPVIKKNNHKDIIYMSLIMEEPIGSLDQNFLVKLNEKF